MKKFVNVTEIQKNTSRRRFRARLTFAFDAELGRKPAPKDFYGSTKAEADRKRSEWFEVYKRTVGADRKRALFARVGGRQTKENRSDSEEAWKHRSDDLGELVGCYEPVIEFRANDPLCRTGAKVICSSCGRPICNNHNHGPEVDSREGYAPKDDGKALCRECRSGIRTQEKTITVVSSCCACGAAAEQVYTSPVEAIKRSIENAGTLLCGRCESKRQSMAAA